MLGKPPRTPPRSGAGGGGRLAGRSPRAVAVVLALASLLLGSGLLAVVGVPEAAAAAPATVTVGSNPSAVGVDPTTDTIYVANQTSNSVSVITVPGAPTLTAATPGNGTVTLAWTAPSSNGGSAVTGYDVYEGTSSGGESSTPVNSSPLSASATSYTVSGLTNGTTYYFTVKALNSVGTSPASNEASATPVTTPGAPRTLTATGGNAQVELSWSAPSSDGGSAVTGYDVYEGTSSGKESPTPVNGSTLITATSYTVSGLTNGTTYYFTVKALNSVGSSTASNQASATPVTTPGAPTGLTATGGNAQVELSWSAPSSDGGSAITGYDVFEGTSSGKESPTPVNGSTLITATSYTVSGLTNGTTYYFTVKALNSVGSSTASNQASATPAGPVKGPAPAPPQAVAIGTGPPQAPSGRSPLLPVGIAMVGLGAGGVAVEEVLRRRARRRA